MGVIKIVVGLCIVVLSTANVFAASACVQADNKVGLVGLDNSNSTVYVSTPVSNNGCNCTNFRFSKVNTDTSMALSLLLSAKISGKSVRIDLLDETNCNSAYRVYLQ